MLPSFSGLFFFFPFLCIMTQNAIFSRLRNPGNDFCPSQRPGPADSSAYLLFHLSTRVPTPFSLSFYGSLDRVIGFKCPSSDLYMGFGWIYVHLSFSCSFISGVGWKSLGL